MDLKPTDSLPNTVPGDSLQRYERSQSYHWNYEHAPALQPKLEIPAIHGPWTHCGRVVPSPLGIAAGPLLNARWILYYAALGFDILTYKTVRSRARECYPLPNLQPVDGSPLSISGLNVAAASQMKGSWAVSFGMPSMDPSIWRADVEYARQQLPKEKILSVSVVASVDANWTEDDIAADFAQCARWALDSGADCIETNFSCPNVATADGQLFQMPGLAAIVAQRVRDTIGATPYIIKLGFVEDEQLATQLVERLSPFADAFSMTNCISATVSEPSGLQLFGGQGRGIGGAAIRAASVRQVLRFARLIRDRGLCTKIIGVGGIAEAAHVREYLDAGAETVQLATSIMLDPLVGLRIRSDW
jgi:dihydroorotate dehydrogenase (NAD+) catalytic subunit